jgi:hypothetical protein
MSRRKTIPQKEDPQAQRFTPDDIVRAIEGVEKAGLEVRGVEITTSGSIKIVTGRVTSKPEASVSPSDEALPTKTKKQKAG